MAVHHSKALGLWLITCSLLVWNPAIVIQCEKLYPWPKCFICIGPLNSTICFLRWCAVPSSGSLRPSSTHSHHRVWGYTLALLACVAKKGLTIIVAEPLKLTYINQHIHPIQEEESICITQLYLCLYILASSCNPQGISASSFQHWVSGVILDDAYSAMHWHLNVHFLAFIFSDSSTILLMSQFAVSNSFA